MDDKGRFQVPTKYRDAIAARSQGALVMTLGRGCLELYPEPDWLPIEKAWRALPDLDSTVEKAKRMYLGNANEVAMDANGRVLVPPSLRERRKLERKVVLVGLGEKLELWDDAAWSAQMDEAETASFDSIAAALHSAHAKAQGAAL